MVDGNQTFKVGFFSLVSRQSMIAALFLSFPVFLFQSFFAAGLGTLYIIGRKKRFLGEILGFLAFFGLIEARVCFRLF